MQQSMYPQVSIQSTHRPQGNNQYMVGSQYGSTYRPSDNSVISSRDVNRDKFLIEGLN